MYTRLDTIAIAWLRDDATHRLSQFQLFSIATLQRGLKVKHYDRSMIQKKVEM